MLKGKLSKIKDDATNDSEPLRAVLKLGSEWNWIADEAPMTSHELINGCNVINGTQHRENLMIGFKTGIFHPPCL